jgi:hypothetical protein
MFPLVAKVVLVQKTFVETEGQRTKRDLAGIVRISKASDTRDGKIFLA